MLMNFMLSIFVIILFNQLIIVKCTDKSIRIFVKNRKPEQRINFVERTIQMSLDADSFLGIGLRHNPLDAFNEQKSQMEVYLSMNRLLFWIVDQQNYINSAGWTNYSSSGRGIIRDLKTHIGEDRMGFHAMKGFLTNFFNDSSSADNFDKEEKQLIDELLTEYEGLTNGTAEPLKDILFYVYLNRKLLKILEYGEDLNVFKNLAENAKGKEKMPTNSPERHIYVQQWLNWVTMYAESWLSSLITVAIQTGTMNANDDANYNENFLAKRLFEHFEAVEDEYFDEIYTPENGHILLEQNRKREIDTFTTKSAQEQQQIVDKIVGKSLAICHILLKLAKEASQANDNFLTTIYSKTLQQLSHKNDHTKRYEHLAQYFGTISFFYGQIYKALIVAQNWLKPSVKFDQRLTELKQECDDATNELAKTNPKLAENNSIKNLLLNNDGIKNLTKTFHDIKSIVNSPKNLSRGSRKAEENGGAIEMIEFDDDLKNLENNEDDITHQQTDTVDFMGNWVWID